MPFPKSICLKVNVKATLEVELAYNAKQTYPLKWKVFLAKKGEREREREIEGLYTEMYTDNYFVCISLSLSLSLCLSVCPSLFITEGEKFKKMLLGDTICINSSLHQALKLPFPARCQESHSQ